MYFIKKQNRKKLGSIFLGIIAAVALSACSGGTENPGDGGGNPGDGGGNPSDGGGNPSDGGGNPSAPTFAGEYVIISQDTFDSDNFSLIYAGQKMHENGVIKVLAFDVTGYDTGGNGGLLFSTAMDGKEDIPVLVNHAQISTRVTPSSQGYSRIMEYPNDGLSDAQRPDSTLELANILRSAPKPVTYVVGGHLHNLAALMQYDLALVQEKIKAVVISTGWQSTSNAKPEMNLSQGTYDATGTSEATRYVFANMPANIKLVLASEPSSRTRPRVSLSNINNSNGLYYLLYNGHYSNKKDMRLGDFEALLWSVNNNSNWSGQSWGTEVKTCFNVSSYGAVTTSSSCTKNNWYVTNQDFGLTANIFTEYIK